VRRRDAVLAAVRFAAEAFLRSPAWDQAVPAVLACLGLAAHDRSPALAARQRFGNGNALPGYHGSDQRHRVMHRV
jgi:hypothetical protein